MLPPLPDNPVLLWKFRNHEYRTGEMPLLMGIVNVTPDSFSDGGAYRNADEAVEHAIRMEEEGADLLDVGGESTRPGADNVTIDEELRRTIPVVRELSRRTLLPISIDTTKAEVARQAILEGATIVNDISGLTFDPDMISVCRDAQVGVIGMHIQGTPKTMQQNPVYADVVLEISNWLSQRLQVLESTGIPRERIVLDPGIGFGKTAEHNMNILANIRRFRALGCPVLIGHSRKRFLGKILGRPADERNYGTAGISIALAEQHADILRVHDVRATRETLIAWREVIRRVPGVEFA